MIHKQLVKDKIFEDQQISFPTRFNFTGNNDVRVMQLKTYFGQIISNTRNTNHELFEKLYKFGPDCRAKVHAARKNEFDQMAMTGKNAYENLDLDTGTCDVDLDETMIHFDYVRDNHDRDSIDINIKNDEKYNEFEDSNSDTMCICILDENCDSIKRFKINYDYSNYKYDILHLLNYKHVKSIVKCRYGDKCYAFERLFKKNGNRIDDQCHCIIYQHPFRTRLNLFEPTKFQGDVNDTNDVNDVKENENENKEQKESEKENDIESNLSRFQAIIFNRETKFDETRSVYNCGISQLDFHASEASLGCLILELEKNKFGYVLHCDKTKYKLIDIAKNKFQHPIYKTLFCETQNSKSGLSVAEMLSVLLYTGCDCYSNLRYTRLNKDYTTWRYFAYFLENAVSKLTRAQLELIKNMKNNKNNNKHKPRFPKRFYCGLNNLFCDSDLINTIKQDFVSKQDKNSSNLNSNEKSQFYVSFNAFTSFTYDYNVALEFLQDGITANNTPFALESTNSVQDSSKSVSKSNGILFVLEIDSWEDEKMNSLADVSWISKFPTEKEFLMGCKWVLQIVNVDDRPFGQQITLNGFNITAN